MSCKGNCNQGRTACTTPAECSRPEPGWIWAFIFWLLVWLACLVAYAVITQQQMGGAPQARGAHIHGEA